jgi:hypothetical protein
MAADDTAKVGYGRPPQPSRFKKGQSGNPLGRRKRVPKKIKTILDEVLDRRMAIRENGIRRRISIRELIVRQLAAKAAKGDSGAFRTLLTIRRDAKASENPPSIVILPPPPK